MNCRWKDKNGNHRYDSFIPEVERPVTAQNEQFPGSQPGEKRKRQARRPTDNSDKGALYHDYSRNVHDWLTHLRRVYFNNQQATMNGKVVKATNQLALPGESLYYVHSKTAYYNSFFIIRSYYNSFFSRNVKILKTSTKSSGPTNIFVLYLWEPRILFKRDLVNS